MKNTKKKLNGKTKVLKSSFTGGNITKYAGLNVISRYVNRQKLVKQLGRLFPTKWYNATKFSKLQVLLSIVYASLSGVSRLKNISIFTNDALVKYNLNLVKAINSHALSDTLKELGEFGARTLESFCLKRNSKWLSGSGITSVTFDADSTVSMVYGNQEGAAKGYNDKKKGCKSYHPLLVFASEIKLLYHSWFRTGSAYTSNGIVDFMKQVQASLPSEIEKVFFRADSGFFNGALFDLLESFGWDYLVKVKLKGLKKLLERKTWIEVEGNKEVAICEFEYQGASWKRKRTLRAIRTVKEYVQVDFFDKKQTVPVYEYACYISNIEIDAQVLHALYTERSTSETWIEQVKSQLMAGKTLTDDFWANDILWQLQTLAYNISVTMRHKHKKIRRQEHKTFREWFICVPAKLVSSGKVTEMKIYNAHLFKAQWLQFEAFIE